VEAHELEARLMLHFGWLLAAASVLALLAAWFRRSRFQSSKTVSFSQAKHRFHLQRERLEARFIQLASASAGSFVRLDCSFADDVAYVRNRATGELSAFVALTVSGGSDNALSTDDWSDDGLAEEVAECQTGTAVFRFDRDHWETDGRAILNLSPEEAVRFYRADLEIVGAELASNS